jgi:hypothetical protein
MVPLNVGMKTNVEVRNRLFLSIQFTKTILTRVFFHTF